MNKCVNGIIVPLTAADIAQREADEQIWESKKEARISQAFDKAISEHVNSKARELGYKSAYEASTYKDSKVAEWAAEVATFESWRDDVWQASEAWLKVNIEKDPGSIEIQGFIETLPEMVMPA